LLVKSLRNVDLSEYLREWLAAAPKTKGNLKLEVDVDPQSFCRRQPSRHCEEAKQSISPRKEEDCFASLAMTRNVEKKKPAVIATAGLFTATRTLTRAVRTGNGARSRVRR
jgi:hypothetical protein